MMNESPLIPLFERWAQERPEQITPLPESGSYRRYYRLTGATRSAIGAINTDRKENIAFLEFSRHFKQHGLTVPEIYAEDIEHDAYLLQDLGDETLLSRLTRLRGHGEFPTDIIPLYKTILGELPRFQIVAGRDLDYSVCYPRAAFDRQSILWDANYFKYYVLKFAKIPFDEQALEDDFQAFADFLLSEEAHFFLYRDFQSRNIMLVDDVPYFIDYQGGRRGALQYDVASLLYDAKAEIPQPVRGELVEHYLQAISRYLQFDRPKFVERYHGYALIRMMQAFGAYGFRGLYEKKAHFIQSIPPALDNLRKFLDSVTLPVKLPALMAALRDLTASETLLALAAPPLTVSIFSFSFKRSLPVDASGNGGGFVFDCRALPNPGRYPEYQHLTGKDDAVMRFLQDKPEIGDFLAHVFALIDGAVNTYQCRHFSHLMVSFGCTGGRHRSVYCAERLADHLRERGVNVALRHIEQGRC
ncbi:hypothetical protein U14_05055 [Candidatus Moduliflexus flocculans]|uniref:Uncharacterized protein n=1 Tax=Candidatus Moduliflexus flocculans TaxID=1499966 RepID=A0A081BQV0_9BACT|nr:hypothetical protein U14_05055 [Candidatus Moduliflexus flocculans]